jgi:hypothetical protein
VTKGKKVLWLWRQAISEKDDHEDDEAEAEAEHEGDKLAAEEKITEKMSFRHQQQFETGKASPDSLKCWIT